MSGSSQGPQEAQKIHTREVKLTIISNLSISPIQSEQFYTAILVGGGGGGGGEGEMTNDIFTSNILTKFIGYSCKRSA